MPDSIKGFLNVDQQKCCDPLGVPGLHQVLIDDVDVLVGFLLGLVCPLPLVDEVVVNSEFLDSGGDDLLE